ncbi:hypothetical protein COY87_00250 [Candidatus Roizmanbacteria bacterium CG_4_10_14_0_8_um_filter_33_9]|uniref:Methyltransferase domain-containing protein n=1 Tax=Candidatus Roizmanbacteria bacterium CG_4_10_14_0_8_um_filter_33_9 TaxID=1974826 RepID=A0A2M7QKN2_9BACT|nr:MAG: hypothetical protein COY87_00250 [Candidatus Roizmanbacteria bacterium CG_4_10_14_0_8_um_filter_33_9]
MLPDYFRRPESLTITKLDQREIGAFRIALEDLLNTIPQGPIIDCFTGACGLYLYPDDLRKRVIGVDSSSFQLRELRSQLLTTETYSPKIIEAYCDNLPFVNESAAAAVAVRGVRYLNWAENRSFTAEAQRILRPDGLLVILDYPTVDLDGAFDLPDIRNLEKIYFDPTKWGEMARELGFRDIVALYNYLPEMRINLVTARK